MKRSGRKPDSWLIIAMRSLDSVRTFRVGMRVFVLLACAGVVLLGALAFFAGAYFYLLRDQSRLLGEVRQLQDQIANADKGTKEANLKTSLPSLTIDSLQVSRKSKRGGFSVSFRLINDSKDGPVSGTLVMVAKNGDGAPSVYQVRPEMPLSNGVPQQPQKGKHFEVQNQKFIEAIFDGRNQEVFKTLMIYIYSPEGKLILERGASIPEE